MSSMSILLSIDRNAVANESLTAETLVLKTKTRMKTSDESPEQYASDEEEASEEKPAPLLTRAGSIFGNAGHPTS